MKPIIKVSGLSKKYRIQSHGTSYNTLRDALARMVRAPVQNIRGRWNGSGQTIWALRDVNFEVLPGEVIGIIGRNGAGKSTLLKILSRITDPTTGRVELYGRVGSLLEVGTGFHPELTGRENLFLNGAILGMKRSEITRKLDEIVAFAEIEKFLDTPVKFYSSGMYMRLAFAVAAHLEPEILIVDEVLAVGDAAFQKKCLGKMGEVAGAGRTVLFVSHNMIAVQNLCGRVFWLENGKMRSEGRTNEIISSHLKSFLSAQSEQIWDDVDTAPGNADIRIRRTQVRPADDAATETMTVSTPLVIEFEYWNLIPGTRLDLSVVINTEAGFPIFNTASGRDRTWTGKPFPVGLFRSRFYIPGNLLNDGAHRVNLYVVRNETEVVYEMADILVFNVEDTREQPSAWHGKWLGAVRPDLTWETEFLGEKSAAQ